MSGWRIRSAGESDVEVIAAFNMAMALETEGRRLEEPTLRRGVLAVVRDPRRGEYFLAGRGESGESRESLVGQLMITREWSDWRCGWFWWIQSVYVLPEARGAGVYRALHEHARAQAHAAGDVCGIRLYVDHDNQPAQRVYRAVGMRQTEYRLYEEDWSATPGRGPGRPAE